MSNEKIETPEATGNPAPPDGGNAGGSPSAAELDELRRQAAKSREHWEQLLRTAAEFDNFKKRAARERQDADKYRNENLLKQLIPVLDNFEMALTAATQGPGASVQSLQTGITMIHQTLRKTLLDAGLEEVDAAGQPFDPNLHDAISQMDSETVPEGHVLQQVRRGYRFRDRLLRPASVVVARKPTPAAEA